MHEGCLFKLLIHWSQVIAIMRSVLYFLFFLSPALANEFCAPPYYGDSPLAFGLGYFHLYSSMEAAITTNTALLDRLKYGFRTVERTEIQFSVEVKVVNGSNTACPDDYGYDDYDKAFCLLNSTDYSWHLCSSLDMTYRYRYNPTLNSVPWLSVVHGGLILVAVAATFDEDFRQGPHFSLTLEIDELHCNPTVFLMKCASTELFGCSFLV